MFILLWMLIRVINNIFSLYHYRRQFDNVKRIFKAVEELPGNITHNIKQLFNISEELAK